MTSTTKELREFLLNLEPIALGARKCRACASAVA
jgi:hypothetical protein